MKKIPGSYDANTEDIMGRIPMGRTLKWRKSLTLTSTQKTPWEEFLWAERSHEENPWLLWRYTDDIMGKILMDETLVQEEHPVFELTTRPVVPDG